MPLTTRYGSSPLFRGKRGAICSVKLRWRYEHRPPTALDLATRGQDPWISRNSPTASRDFVQSAQTLAIREGNPQITPEHLLKVLLDDPEGLAAG